MASNLENDEGNEPEDTGSEARATLSTPRLVEGVRDFLLLNLKQAHLQKPWPQMPEKEQKMWINRIEERAERLVQDVIDRVATGSFPVVHAKIKNFKVENGAITITANGFADDEVLLTLNHAGPKAVKIIVADGEQFDEERDPLNPDPDQPGLPGVKLNDEPGFEDDDQPTVEEPEIENPEGEAEAGEEVLKSKSDEWRGGFNSRMGGHFRNENPFNVATQLEANSEWFAGWDAADFDDKAPALKDVEKPEKKPRKPKAGPKVEPDIEPEVEQPADDMLAAGPQGDDITDQDGVVIESAEQAHAFGMWCRKDGKGTGSNPFLVASDFGKAWLRGYSDQRRAESQAMPGDDEF